MDKEYKEREKKYIEDGINKMKNVSYDFNKINHDNVENFLQREQRSIQLSKQLHKLWKLRSRSIPKDNYSYIKMNSNKTLESDKIKDLFHKVNNYNEMKNYNLFIKQPKISKKLREQNEKNKFNFIKYSGRERVSKIKKELSNYRYLEKRHST